MLEILASLVTSGSSIDADSEHRPKALAGSHEAEAAAARQGAGRRSHRLQRNELLVLGGKDLRVTVTLKQIDADLAFGFGDRERCPLFIQGKAVVETALAELFVESDKLLLRPGRNTALVE